MIVNMVGRMVADKLELMKIEEDIEEILEPKMHEVTKDILDTLCLYFTNDSIKSCKVEKTRGNISNDEFKKLFNPGCPEYINEKSSEFIKSYLEYIDENLLNNNKIADYMLSYGGPDNLFFLEEKTPEDREPNNSNNEEQLSKITDLETKLEDLQSKPSDNNEVLQLQTKLEENTLEIENLKQQVQEIDDLRRQLAVRDDKIKKLEDELSNKTSRDVTISGGAIPDATPGAPSVNMAGAIPDAIPGAPSVNMAGAIPDAIPGAPSVNMAGAIPTDLTSALPGGITKIPSHIDIESNKAVDVLDYYTESVKSKLKCDGRIHKYIQKKVVDVILFTAVRRLTPPDLQLLKPYAKNTTEKHIDKCISIIKTNIDNYSSLLKDNMENDEILNSYLRGIFELYVYYEYCQNSKLTISMTKDEIIEHIKTANVVEMIHKDSTNTAEINPYLKSFDEASVQKLFDMDKHNKKTASNFIDLFKKVKTDDTTTSGGSKRRKKNLKNKHTLPAYRKRNCTQRMRRKK